jgi:hypothetical protein
VEVAGKMIAITIDGMDAIDACYAFAGIVGISPAGLSLRRLWAMAEGKARFLRHHQVGQASAVWGLSDSDPLIYAEFGILQAVEIGKPVKYSDEMQAKINTEVARIYEQEPELKSRIKYGQG